jgi:hypothetical protein
VVFGKDKLHFGINGLGRIHKGLNIMELGNNARMALFEDIFHMV